MFSENYHWYFLGFCALIVLSAHIAMVISENKTRDEIDRRQTGEFYSLYLPASNPKWRPFFEQLPYISAVFMFFAMMTAIAIAPGTDGLYVAVPGVIGIVLALVYAIYLYLRCSLPLPEIIISKNPLSFNEDVNIKWSIPLNYSFDKLYVSIEFIREDTVDIRLENDLNYNPVGKAMPGAIRGVHQFNPIKYYRRDLTVIRTIGNFEFSGKSDICCGSLDFMVPSDGQRYYNGMDKRYFWSVALRGEQLRGGRFHRVFNERYEFSVIGTLPEQSLNFDDDPFHRRLKEQSEEYGLMEKTSFNQEPRVASLNS